jgi:hypothetical protein
MRKDRGKPLPVWKDGEIHGWAWVSDEDWPRLKQYTWWTVGPYVFRSMYTDEGAKTTIPMHRDIMELKNGDPLEVDHIDRDTFNNRRSNLRVVTRWIQEGNHDFSKSSSKKIGVSYDQRLRKWKAQGSLDGTYVYLGVYETEEAAVLARQMWEQENDRVRPEEQVRLDESEEKERSDSAADGAEEDG